MAAQAAMAGAKMAISLYASGEQIKAKQQQLMAEAALAQQARTIAGNRETQAYLSNVQALKDQNTAENFSISQAEAEAYDTASTSMAGSGISGASVDEINTTISRSVGQDRAAAKSNFDSQRGAMNVQRKQSNENRIYEAKSAKAYDTKADLQGAIFKAVGDGLS